MKNVFKLNFSEVFLPDSRYWMDDRIDLYPYWSAELEHIAGDVVCQQYTRKTYENNTKLLTEAWI